MTIDMLDNKEMLEAILSTIDEGIHVVNSEGVTIYYNPLAAKHDGIHVQDALGKHILDVFPSLTEETSTLLKVIKSKEPIMNQQQTYTNLRGQQIHTVNTTLPIHVQGKLVGAVEIAKDLTKVKELSEKLLDLQAQVHQHKRKKGTKEIQPTSAARYQMNHIITKNPQLQKVKADGLKIAATSSSVLVYGETGTGKELLVQAIHNASARRNEPFIAQNCAAIPATLLEGILFGTVKGGFTGAVNRPGLFELADGGTLFLDEINSMPIDIQVKLLRVLQDGVVHRVGATKGYSYDVRIIAALNEDPLVCLEKNLLRTDLYYRINVISLTIPPLRERLEDLQLLVPHFIRKFNYRFQKLVTQVDPAVYQLFVKYTWPGNIRELEHALEAAMNLVEGDTLRVEHLPPTIVNRHQASSFLPKLSSLASLDDNSDRFPLLREALAETERQLIEQAMHTTKGNIQQAAKLLAIPRQTLQYKLHKLKES